MRINIRPEPSLIIDFLMFAVRYNPSDPIVLFCVQAGIIILLTRFLAVFLGKLRQPKVISEVIGGILLFVQRFASKPTGLNF